MEIIGFILPIGLGVLIWIMIKVVVESHNKYEAQIYQDDIQELSFGKDILAVVDVQSNKSPIVKLYHKVTVEGNTMTALRMDDDSKSELHFYKGNYYTDRAYNALLNGELFRR